MKSNIRSAVYLVLVGLVGATSCKEAPKKTENIVTETFIDTMSPATETVVQTETIDSAGSYKTFYSEAIMTLDSNDAHIKMVKTRLQKSKKPQTKRITLLTELENKNVELRQKVKTLDAVLLKDFAEFEIRFKEDVHNWKSSLANLTKGEDFD